MEITGEIEWVHPFCGRKALQFVIIPMSLCFYINSASLLLFILFRSRVGNSQTQLKDTLIVQTHQGIQKNKIFYIKANYKYPTFLFLHRHELLKGFSSYLDLTHTVFILCSGRTE